MDVRNYVSADYMPSVHLKTPNNLNKVSEIRHLEGQERVTGRAVAADKVPEISHFEGRERVAGHAAVADVDIDLREVYFLVMHFLSSGPCQKTFVQFLKELDEHQLLPRRYHSWYSRTGIHSAEENDDGVSVPLTYEKLLHRYLNYLILSIALHLASCVFCKGIILNDSVDRNYEFYNHNINISYYHYL